MIELNGVANIKLILDMAKADKAINPDLAASIDEQLLLLEKYMLAVADHVASIKAGAYGALIVGQEVPFWHEVRANPEQFPTARERVQGMKRQMAGEE